MWWDANQEVRLQSTVSLDTSDLESLVSSCSNDYRGSEIINSATLSKSPELYYSLIKMDVGNNNISMPSDTTASSPAQVHSSSDPDLSLHNSEENIVTTSSPDDGYSVSSSSDARGNTGSQSDIISNVLSCISRVAPANKFDPLISKKRKKKARQKKLKKVLHPDLITMWQHCSQLCAEPDVSPATPTPSPYPRVDWSRVNQRMLANLPKPERFPVHGCAQDESFFVKRQVTVAHDSVRFWSPYEEAGSYPYGSLPGFLTQDGVIAPGGHGENVHGYVWSPDYQGWVLQATNPQKQNKDKAAFVFNKKFKRTKRPR